MLVNISKNLSQVLKNEKETEKLLDILSLSKNSKDKTVRVNNQDFHVVISSTDSSPEAKKNSK